MDGDKPRLRHPFRPPVKHVYGLQPHMPLPGPETGALPGAIMQGEGKARAYDGADRLASSRLSATCVCATHTQAPKLPPP